MLLERGTSGECYRCSLDQPFVVLGREVNKDVIVHDPRISRRHLYLQVLGGHVFCVDLNSRTGTHWPDGPRTAGWLQPRQSLQVGDSTLRIVDEPATEKPFSEFDPMAPGCVQEPSLTLEFLGKRASCKHWSMNRTLAFIGTSDRCKVRLHDSAVAAIHGSLVATPQGVWVVDLLGPAGIHVNGQRVRVARLRHGDELQVASFLMRVHGESSAIAAAAQPVALPAAASLAVPSLAVAAQAPISLALAQTATIVRAQQGGEITALDGAAALGDNGENIPRAVVEAVLVPILQQFSLVQNQMFDQFQDAMTMMFQMFGALQKDQMERIREELARVQDVTAQIQSLQAELRKPLARERLPHSPPHHQQQSLSTDAGSSAVPAVVPWSLPSGNGNPGGPEIHSMLWKRMAELQEDRRSRLQKILSFMSGK